MTKTELGEMYYSQFIRGHKPYMSPLCILYYLIVIVFWCKRRVKQIIVIEWNEDIIDE